MHEMDELLRRDIAEHYDCGCWENVTGIIWENGTPWQLIKFERDVEYYGAMWRCLIITKLVYVFYQHAKQYPLKSSLLAQEDI